MSGVIEMTEGKTNAAGVCVDTEKLADGLKTMFCGLSEVFSAIGADDAAGKAKEAGDAVGGTEAFEEVQSGPAETSQAGTGKDESNPKAVKTSVSMAEIIKIVTKKIETDRQNSARIGEIVKSFGIAKLTELPEEKYEAFLTQLTAL